MRKVEYLFYVGCALVLAFAPLGLAVMAASGALADREAKKQ